jgi:cell division protein FtsI (penicillin-binding protein 3)
VSLRPDASVAHPGRMPDVRGLTLRDALFLLENRGLKVQASGSGRVREQSVAPGDFAKRGLVVGLMLTPTAAPTAAPLALPAPVHTEVEENTLLIPAESGTRAKALKPTALAAKSTTNKAKASAAKPTAASSETMKSAAKVTTKPASPSTKEKSAAGKQSAAEPKAKPAKTKKPAPNKVDIRTTQRRPTPSPAPSVGTTSAKNRKSA